VTLPTCSRSWEAEAVEDGRLAGSDRASFERHATCCAVCAGEVAALSSLRRRMREIALSDPTDLELRRARVGLLQRAHALREHERPVARRAWAIACALAAVAFFAWFVDGRIRSSHSEPASASMPVAGPSFDFVNVAGAAVASGKDGDDTRAALSDGMAAFHVEHVLPGRRFLLSLPDGEIEVRGTRFTVSVRGGRTERVEVTEGVVILLLRGEGERRLVAGDRWTAPLPAGLSAPSRRPETTSQVSGEATPGLVTERARTNAPPAARTAPDSRSSEPPSEAAPSRVSKTANDRFAAAMATFQAGSYGQADSLLASFAQDFPGDPRTEDAAFLRAVARSRLGDSSGAAMLARAYLEMFPGGLRRQEAEQLVREGAKPLPHTPDGL
jgi:hypothetical protein